MGVCIRGVESASGGLHPWGLHPGGDLHPEGGSASGGLGRPTDPPSDTTGYGQRVGGTYPTGMHLLLLTVLANHVSAHEE